MYGNFVVIARTSSTAVELQGGKIVVIGSKIM